MVVMLVSVVGGVFIVFALMALCYRSVVVHRNLSLCLRLVESFHLMLVSASVVLTLARSLVDLKPNLDSPLSLQSIYLSEWKPYAIPLFIYIRAISLYLVLIGVRPSHTHDLHCRYSEKERDERTILSIHYTYNFSKQKHTMYNQFKKMSKKTGCQTHRNLGSFWEGSWFLHPFRLMFFLSAWRLLSDAGMILLDQ